MSQEHRSESILLASAIVHPLHVSFPDGTNDRTNDVGYRSCWLLWSILLSTIAPNIEIF